MSKIVSVKSKNVNSKILFKSIDEIVREGHHSFVAPSSSYMLFSVEYSYAQLAEYIDMSMEDLSERALIRQYDVICDHRNNPPADGSKDVIMTIRFRQTHCLNWTEITYTFR
jgi:hypothetical protein